MASSTNGQLTPPVMGAAAFLIAEFTGISYTDIIKHALVPALVFLYCLGVHRASRSIEVEFERPAQAPISPDLVDQANRIF